MNAATIAILITAALAQFVHGQSVEPSPVTTQRPCIDELDYCGRFISSECTSYALHLRCPALCGECTSAPSLGRSEARRQVGSPTLPPSPAGIFRSGRNIDITSAAGGTIRLNGQDLVRWWRATLQL